MAIRSLFISLLLLVASLDGARAQAVGTCPGGVSPAFAGCLPPIVTALTATDGINVFQGGRPAAIWGVAGIGQLPFLSLGGGTVTGPIALPANPTLPLQAATKQYVDVLGSPPLSCAGQTTGKLANIGGIVYVCP